MREFLFMLNLRDLQPPAVVQSRVALSRRDQAIVALARRKLSGMRPDFSQAATALYEAVAELIPAGRIFLLGQTNRGPIVGSLISGVGVVQGEHAVELVQVVQHQPLRRLGRLCP